MPLHAAAARELEPRGAEELGLELGAPPAAHAGEKRPASLPLLAAASGAGAAAPKSERLKLEGGAAAAEEAAGTTSLQPVASPTPHWPGEAGAPARLQRETTEGAPPASAPAEGSLLASALHQVTAAAAAAAAAAAERLTLAEARARARRTIAALAEAYPLPSPRRLLRLAAEALGLLSLMLHAVFADACAALRASLWPQQPAAAAVAPAKRGVVRQSQWLSAQLYSKPNRPFHRSLPQPLCPPAQGVGASAAGALVASVAREFAGAEAVNAKAALLAERERKAAAAAEERAPPEVPRAEELEPAAEPEEPAAETETGELLRRERTPPPSPPRVTWAERLAPATPPAAPAISATAAAPSTPGAELAPPAPAPAPAPEAPPPVAAPPPPRVLGEGYHGLELEQRGTEELGAKVDGKPLPAAAQPAEAPAAPLGGAAAAGPALAARRVVAERFEPSSLELSREATMPPSGELPPPASAKPPETQPAAQAPSAAPSGAALAPRRVVAERLEPSRDASAEEAAARAAEKVRIRSLLERTSEMLRASEEAPADGVAAPPALLPTPATPTATPATARRRRYIRVRGPLHKLIKEVRRALGVPLPPPPS
jgi:hypothetical protein